MKLFPTEIYHRPLGTRLAAFQRELIKECYQIAAADNDGRKWSKRNYPQGFTSYGSLAELHRVSGTFARLKERLDRHVAAFARRLEMDTKNHRLELTHLWLNIVPTHGYHGLHLHPLSSLSGSYYLQMPPDSGAIKFEDPRLTCFMGSLPRRADARPEHRHFVSLEPKAGDLVLFESWLRHEVTQNRSREDRISVSFNYNWF